MLQLKDIRKTFGQNEVLKGVNFAVYKGEVVVILGPSGSGKSTLLRTMNFLEVPSSGDMFLEGESMLYREQNGNKIKRDPKEWNQFRMEIGMVFQGFHLFPHMTVLENIIEGPVHVRKQAKEEAITYGESLLKKVGLSDKRDAHPFSLSGGQQQRVAIARSLAMRPKIVLFDEPTSALDPELVGEVLSVMKELKEEGLTMVVVTHEMGFAQDAADRIVFMDDGNIIHEAPPEQFFGKNQPDRVQKFLQRYEGGNRL
ncbi:amino acid ABC transporter ATP-binding protein, PAAT family [Seinonella peptonophila]|uniref:Amino acid ABC transporter ATP-binding protein, PAAT family n=1 Tax=Seinonella peptonophila TaxID=112248 RepID=A0A1M4SMH0_9BACL|nr:amino acid ABC transporter ATP-binding protein [Seinonella peptonophila]SHE33433.1 amino acid ABC transporter ATP-binding protein, PAAT family [Seinonella peptonophila]